MKKVMKITISAVLLLVLAVAFAACGNDGGTAAAPEPPAAVTPAPAAAAPAAADIQIALVAHSPESILNDGSFNQGAWDGINRFLDENGIPSGNATFFQAVAADNDARFNVIVQAIEGGANVLVLPGFQFEYALYGAQDLFPDVNFILLDATPARDGNRRIENNVAAIHYAEAEAGFLAGYAAVMEGYRRLGFMGGNPIPPVERFGHGFIQGAEHAANSLGLAVGDVEINYMYLGGFGPSPEHVVTASSWFVAGTELIFAAAGGAGGSVMEGALQSGGTTIGVDSDQYHVNHTVLTSAMKALDVSVYDMLTDIMNGAFRGGREHIFDASLDGVGLPMHNSRFENFTQAQYDAIFNQLATGAIRVNPSTDISEILSDISLVVVNEM